MDGSITGGTRAEAFGAAGVACGRGYTVKASAVDDGNAELGSDGGSGQRVYAGVSAGVQIAVSADDWGMRAVGAFSAESPLNDMDAVAC